MKAEGSVVSSPVLHKVKVKEETKECCFQQQQHGSPSTTNTERPSATIINVVGSTSTNSPSTTNSSLTTNSSTKDTSFSLSSQNSTIICQVASTVTSIQNGTEPVDLEVKKKGVSSQSSYGKDENSQESIGKENRSSPNSLKARLLQSNVNSLEKDFPRGQLSSGSSGNESPSSSHSIKPEGEDFTSSRQEDPSQPSNSVEASSAVLNGGLRCITSVFAGHAKLKRLLGTLVQFANNISTETGDTVRTLVLSLLSGGMTAEEFHVALQEATNFPLRDFVLPYLRHTLPSLRRNLNAAATANNQTCVQFLRANESAVLETVNLAPTGETVEFFRDHSTNGNSNSSNVSNYVPRSASTNSCNPNQQANSAPLHHYNTGATNLATKRRASDNTYYENGSDDAPIYGKRSGNPWSHHAHQQQQQSDLYCWYHPIHSSTSIQNQTQFHGHGPSLVQINPLSSFGPPPPPSQQQQQQQQQLGGHLPGQNGSTLDDEWKNIHVMLNCILGMVEKTKRALVILQRRGSSSPAAAPPSGLAGTQNGSSNGNITTTNGSQIESTTGDRDGNLKRLSGEIVAQTIRATEDRVAAEVKRRAEEAVLEVKRAAMAEVQRAVAAAVAESRASERLRVHQLLDSTMAQRNQGSSRHGSFLRVGSHTNQNEASSKTTPAVAAPNSTGDDEKEGTLVTSVMGSSCWNCGRPALETCGGCGIARYCGAFCQHRDWEAGGHHVTCRSSPTQESRRSPSRSPPRIGSTVLGNTSEVDSAIVTTKGK